MDSGGASPKPGSRTVVMLTFIGMIGSAVALFASSL